MPKVAHASVHGVIVRLPVFLLMNERAMLLATFKISLGQFLKYTYILKKIHTYDFKIRASNCLITISDTNIICLLVMKMCV